MLRQGLSFTELLVALLSSLAVIFITLPVHEFAHGYVATRLGDPTPRWQGRLTLNPMAHIDWFGAGALLLFGIGWAKPVQVDARYFKNAKWGMAITALAGPVSNIILSLVVFIIYFILLSIAYVCGFWFNPVVNFLASFLDYVAYISIYLAVFNLIPIPPFDGSRILFTFLPQKYYFMFMRYERYIFLGVLALLYIGVLDAPISFLTSSVYNGVFTLVSLPFKSIIGW